jgi:cellulose synthase/poly-beta-1,6-N-acetylglucosamine synthase-like glycosyltransferase
MGDQAAAPVLSIVISTLGTRPAELERLLRSITPERLDGLEIVVVDQSPSQTAHRVARDCLAGLDIPLVCLTSGLGVSRGRNAGLEVARGAFVTFPDDDAWYPPGGLTAMLGRIEADPHLDALTFVARGSDGRISSNRFARRAGPIRPHLVFRQGFASAMFFRTDAIRRAGGFDAEIGPGSQTPWGAGEEPEILMRMLAGGATMRFDPTLFVQHEDPDLAPDAMRDRIRLYSQGVGYAVAKNGATTWHVPMLVVRPALGLLLATILRQHDVRRYRAARIGGHLRGVRGGLRARRSHG